MNYTVYESSLSGLLPAALNKQVPLNRDLFTCSIIFSPNQYLLKIIESAFVMSFVSPSARPSVRLSCVAVCLWVGLCGCPCAGDCILAGYTVHPFPVQPATNQIQLNTTLLIVVIKSNVLVNS